MQVLRDQVGKPLSFLLKSEYFFQLSFMLADPRKRGRTGEAAKREGPAGGRHEDSGGQAAEERGRADRGRGEVRGEERVAGSPGEGDGRAGIMGWRILYQGH